MATAFDSTKAFEACKALAEELTRVTGRMTQVRLELDIAKYSGDDADDLLSALDDVQNRACRVAYLAGVVTVGVAKQAEQRRRSEAMRRLGTLDGPG